MNSVVRGIRSGGLVILASVLVMLLVTPSVWADSVSDSRATFSNGNVTTCSDVSLGSDTQLGSSSDSNASDGNVSGTVTTNAGSIQPGTGQELDVTITGSNIVIDAVVVKGANGYNVYSNLTYFPPTLLAPQHYISPTNNGGNIPTISHWFVCYHTGVIGVSAFPALGRWAPEGLIVVFAGTALGVVLHRRRRLNLGV